MENEAFDDALRGWIAGEELPASTQDWQRMAARLDRHEGIIAVPRKAAAKNRRYLWLLPLAAAASLCAVIFRTGIYKEGSQQGTEVASKQKSAAPITDKVSAQPEDSRATTATTHAGNPHTAVAMYPHQNSKSVLPERTSTSLPVQTDTAAFARKPEPISPALGDKIVSDDKRPQPYAGPDLTPQSEGRRKAAVGVFGGYNIGQAKNDFTLGLMLSKKLGGRLHLETNVAVVSGSYDSYRSVFRQGISPGAGVGASTSEYEAAPKQLLYLQASPSLSYELYRGLSAGGGIDAQRLLSASSSAQLLSSAGNKEAPQPDWDLGLTGRVDYQVAKKLRAGFVYRSSIYGQSKSSADAARRNYLLVQLGYTIF